MTLKKKRSTPRSGATRRKSDHVRTRLDADVRSKMIVEAAFEAIARDGFEGLRTRDIAKVVGINSATLHHHFPTKEDLIEGVANHLETRFRQEKTRPAENEPAVDALYRQLKDVIFYAIDRQEMLAVYRELVDRAPRDPAIRRLVQRLHAAWRLDIVETLKKGRNDSSLRADLDVDAAAGIVLSTAWGFIARIFSSKEEFDSGFRELVKLLLAKKTART